MSDVIMFFVVFTVIAGISGVIESVHPRTPGQAQWQTFLIGAVLFAAAFATGVGPGGCGLAAILAMMLAPTFARGWLDDA